MSLIDKETKLLYENSNVEMNEGAFMYSDVQFHIRAFRKHLIHNGKEHLDVFDGVFGEFWREP